jgi:hypothetical protein
MSRIVTSRGTHREVYYKALLRHKFIAEGKIPQGEEKANRLIAIACGQRNEDTSNSARSPFIRPSSSSFHLYIIPTLDKNASRCGSIKAF